MPNFFISVLIAGVSEMSEWKQVCQFSKTLASIHADFNHSVVLLVSLIIVLSS